MKSYGYSSIADLARAIGHDRSENLSRIMRKKNAKPSVDIVADFANKFDDLNLGWLITGKGDPRVPRIGSQAYKPQTSQNYVPPDVPPDAQIPQFASEPPPTYGLPPVVTVALDGKPNIVMLDAQAAAGLPVHLNEPEFFANKPAFRLPGERYRNGTLIAIQVTGDSMEPTVGHQDWLIARHLEAPLAMLREGYLYVLVAQDGVVAKRLFRAPGGTGFICRSDNELYPPYELPLEEALQVYKVEAVLSEDLSNKGADIRERLARVERDIMALQRPSKRL